MDAVDEQEKFKMYYEYREAVKTIPSHRMLAIRRGEGESVLYWLIEVEEPRVLAVLRSRVLRDEGDWTPQLHLAIEDCWKRLLNTSIQGELRLELKRRSDTDAIQVFRENLQHLFVLQVLNRCAQIQFRAVQHKVQWTRGRQQADCTTGRRRRQSRS